MRPAALGVLLGCCLAGVVPAGQCADLWGGSADITSDYLVRGVSRSADHAAAQFDLHYVDHTGLLAGAFASSAQIERDDSREAELSAYVGWVWTTGSDWRGKVLGSYYSYPWDDNGSIYNYGELDVDVTYQGWVNATVSYFPGAPRYRRYVGQVRVGAESAELNFQHPIWAKLSATAGIGYYELEGRDSTGYGYGSVGLAYDLAPVSLTLSYVDAGAAAKTLFYNAASGGRWTGTVIWRF